MAKILNITDGTPISLINDSGFNLILKTPWKPATPTSHNKLDERVTETMKLKLNGTSHNNLAIQEQALRNLLRKAFNYDNTTWQNTPVYLTYKGDNETNTRYALVVDGKLKDAVSIIDETASKQNEFMEMTLEIEREAGWRDKVPGAYPSALTLTATDGPAAPTRVHVANHRDLTAGALTHLFDFDVGAGFSANLIASDSFTYFGQGGDDPTANDIFYWGSTTAAFHNVVMNWTLGDWSANGTWEYWNGGWTAIPTKSYGQYPHVTPAKFWSIDTGDSQHVIAVANLTDWATTAINSVTAYWIRFKLSSVGSFVSSPVQLDQVVYAQQKSHLDLPATAIDGDMPPLLHIGARVVAKASPTTPDPFAMSRVIIGVKSRGLSGFISPISFIDENMPDTDAGTWDQNLSGGASEDVDPIGPEGKRITIPFTTTGTLLIERVRIDTQVGATVEAFKGTYRVLGRMQQTGGAVGDVSVKIRVELGSDLTGFSITDTDVIASKSVDDGPEVFDFGVLKIPAGEIAVADNDLASIVFSVFAKDDDGNADLHVYDVYLMPIDEWSVVVDAPVSVGNAASSLGSSVIELDAGVVVTRTIKSINPGTAVASIVPSYPVVDLNLFGTYPILEPSKAYRFYFMAMYYDGAYGTGPFLSAAGSHLVAELRATDRYANLIGAD